MTVTSRVVVLGPMPLELEAIVTAFGLDADKTGRVGGCDVRAAHIGMGPPATRTALRAILAGGDVDHVMIAGICGGLDPDLPVGTLLNPLSVVDHSTGVAYRHDPPGGAPQRGHLVTTEKVMFDDDLSRRLFAEGFLGVDMETSAVGEVCEALGVPWSAYRCIGDRYVDGLLDQRLVSMTNPDGSADIDAISRLLAAEPDLGPKLEQLAHDSALAARTAAEAAVAGCRALGGGA